MKPALRSVNVKGKEAESCACEGHQWINIHLVCRQIIIARELTNIAGYFN